MNWGVFASTFLAATIEVIEMVAIVVAVGVTRSWTVAALIGAGLLVTWRLVEADIPAWWALPLVVLGANVQSLYRAVRKEGADSG
jgi:uncharacterized membrane protein